MPKVLAYHDSHMNVTNTPFLKCDILQIAWTLSGRLSTRFRGLFTRISDHSCKSTCKFMDDVGWEGLVLTGRTFQCRKGTHFHFGQSVFHNLNDPQIFFNLKWPSCFRKTSATLKWRSIKLYTCTIQSGQVSVHLLPTTKSRLALGFPGWEALFIIPENMPLMWVVACNWHFSFYSILLVFGCSCLAIPWVYYVPFLG